LLYTLLAACLPEPALAWLRESARKIKSGERKRDLYMSFSAVPRYVPRDLLAPSAEEGEEAARYRAGLDLSHWTLQEAARVWLLLQLPPRQNLFTSELYALFDTADLGEQLALYKGFALFPFPEHLRSQAAEGIRTNMTSVFDAIALDNPYPADYLPEEAWNQMVLKAAFLDRPLYRIQGLDERANARLARIVSDYAHERWAAGRVVSPELWRAAGESWNETLAADARRLFADPHPLQRQAAALLCRRADHPDAQALLREQAQAGPLPPAQTWDALARDWWDQQKAHAQSHPKR
jgi:hypothetical protein